MPKDHSSSKRWFLQNICCMSSRSEALECEACEEAARHVIMHLVHAGADLSLGPVCVVQARMPQQDIAGLFALLYSARNLTLQRCPLLVGNEVCCAFTDTPSPKLWRRGDCCVFTWLIRQMWGFLMPSSPQLDPAKHHFLAPGWRANTKTFLRRADAFTCRGWREWAAIVRCPEE